MEANMTIISKRLFSVLENKPQIFSVSYRSQSITCPVCNGSGSRVGRIFGHNRQCNCCLPWIFIHGTGKIPQPEGFTHK